MKRLPILLLVAAGLVFTAPIGCASSGKSSGSYYSRGSIHRDSFPAPGGPGSPYRYRYGRPGRYRR